MNMHALRVMIGCTAVCRAAPTDNPACLQTGFVCLIACPSGQHAHACSASRMSKPQTQVPFPVGCRWRVLRVPKRNMWTVLVSCQ